MGYVTIRTLTYGKNWVSFDIESQGLYKIHCLSGVPIESLDKILQVCITDKNFILLTEDRDFRDGALTAPWVKDDRSTNNVWVYDINGTLLWNIGSIVGDIKMAFDGIGCAFKSEAELEYGHKFPSASEVLLIGIAAGLTFIIDVDNKTLLAKIPCMVQ